MKKIENAVNAILEGSVLTQRLEAEVRRLEQRKHEILQEINGINNDIEQFVTEEMIKQKYEEYLKALKGNFRTRRNLVLQLIEKVTVHPNGFIKIEDKI